MDKDTIISSLLTNYGKYGITRAELEAVIDDGIRSYDLSLEAIYNGLRMSLASAYNVHGHFSLEDVMAITGESREELLQRIEQCRHELIEAGETRTIISSPQSRQGQWSIVFLTVCINAIYS